MSGDVVFILGMGRSGTSALTRVLSLCGCRLPDVVMGADDWNPKGCWEPAEALRLNVDFLNRAGVVGDPSMRLEERGVGQQEKEEFVQTIQAFLSSCRGAVPLVIKEPRITHLMEFWTEAAYREGFTIKALVAFRHPEEVFASMRRVLASSARTPAHTTSVETSNAFWLKANLLAERHSRSFPRVFVEYSNLMKNWRGELARVLRDLSIELEVNDAVESFLTGDLHRHRYAGPVSDTFAYSWVTRVYKILSAAAADKPIDLTSMDEIYSAYRQTARAFRISMDEGRDLRMIPLLREPTAHVPIWKSGEDF